jgi:hypothetical protein
MTMTALDFLFISLGVSAFLISIFLSIMLYNVSLTMKETNRVLGRADDTIDQVNRYLAIPLKIFMEASNIISNIKERYSDTNEEENEKTR